jgi:gamma-glutamylcyclotransferase (GGCT)/AIG2-like uncharacterized protein YtfP
MVDNLPIFIYGTLRAGQKNYEHFLAGRTVREVPASTCGELYLFLDPGGDRYPFLIPGIETVRGDLVYLEKNTWEETLSELDQLEDYHPQTDSGLYLRRKKKVVTETGESVVAWAYLWNGSWTETLKIEGGDFAAWMSKRGSEI